MAGENIERVGSEVEETIAHDGFASRVRRRTKSDSDFCGKAAHDLCERISSSIC